ncbi:winged helix-turn-helix transcriptional regulator [Plantactinospora endophytica]|uniref:Transcriptional regulator n=1 Tax=Plantactinospora endophytica TaxID=673535 RepID=A0ABQ4E9N9_9ACTN|nr:helix-turn-helix domain-containing protein [Plantactinospora endophytica]GIG91451.1 transcriptional regulator [Plantactinospora endophytica]
MSAANTGVTSLASAALPMPVPAEEYDSCPVTDVVRLMSDKWSMVVLVLLGRRSHRFNELHRSIDGISQRMLTRTLRGLGSSGLVLRQVRPTVPPSVEYGLTPLGESLLEPLSGLAEWAVRNWPEIAAARNRVPTS